MSNWNFVLRLVEHEKSFITLELTYQWHCEEKTQNTDNNIRHHEHD